MFTYEEAKAGGAFRMLKLRGGRIVCPACGRKTDFKVLPETSASNLVVFCRKCGSERTVSIVPRLPQRAARNH